MIKKKLAKKILITAALLAILFFLLFPFVLMVSTSLKAYEDVNLWPPRWIPEKVQWQNFSEIWKGSISLKTAFVNSLIVSLSTMGLCVIIGCLAAYAVSRYNFRGKKIFMFAMIMTQMFSAVILVAPMYQIMKELKLLNTYLALIVPNTAFALPMTIWLLVGYFDSVPQSLEEAALMDGCTKLQAIRKVLVPLLAPGIITSGLFAFIAAWNDLLFAQTFITKPELRTLTIALVNYRGAFETYWHTTMAASVISVVPVFVLFLAIQKYLIKGLSSGAVKE